VTRTKDQDKWHERGFAAGTAVAAAIIVKVWGDEVQAEEVMASAGLGSRAKCKALGVDDYDLKILRPVFQSINRKVRERRRG
jgi:hypothetical protein